MLRPRLSLITVVAALAFVARAEQTPATKPSVTINSMLQRVGSLVEPAEAARTFTATLRVTKADGLPKEVSGATVEIAVQAPDRLGLVAKVAEHTVAVCRDGQELWAHVPEKKFG